MTPTPATLLRFLLAATLLFAMTQSPDADAQDANYDESKVGDHPLPDPLRTEAGKPVTTARQWRASRRPETLRLFEQHVFGVSPSLKSVSVKAEVTSQEPRALGGMATRSEITLTLRSKQTPSLPPVQIHVLLFVPNNAPKPAPAFLGLNFNGNHAVHSDPTIALSKAWMRNDPRNGVENNRATDKTRGSEASRWQVEKVVGRGYALATAYYGDIDPDFHDGFTNGVHSLFPNTPRSDDSWGTIAAWAWGLSQILTYLDSRPDINGQQVAVIGHSRLGKTSLWAGATDQRFAIVISNNSGCGGAALSRRNFGETVQRINTSFPHWFCLRHRTYNANEAALPVDHHQLIALAAPRPVYVASAQEDQWADPRGEFLGAYHAGPVYQLLGFKGVGSATMPGLNQPVGDRVGYHIRTGKHDVTEYDWEQYLNFADRHLKRPTTRQR